MPTLLASPYSARELQLPANRPDLLGYQGEYLFFDRDGICGCRHRLWYVRAGFYLMFEGTGKPKHQDNQKDQYPYAGYDFPKDLSHMYFTSDPVY